jgi:hypothetical protein
MLSIAIQYTKSYGVEAIPHFVADLMAGNPEQFKAGYTRENAIIAAATAFDTSRKNVEAHCEHSIWLKESE